jgi:hypothetical protein
MFLLKVGFCIVLEKVSPGNRLLADKGLNVFQGIAVLENNIVNIELTAGFNILCILARAIPFQKSGR